MKFDPHNRIVLSNDSKIKLPYKFIIEIYEGRLKGQYPPGIEFIPHMKRKWDQGGFGSGRTLKDSGKFEMAGEALEFLRRNRVRPLEGNVEMYKIMIPGSHRQRTTARELEMLSRI